LQSSAAPLPVGPPAVTEVRDQRPVGSDPAVCPVGQPDCAALEELSRLRKEVRELSREVRIDALTGLFNYGHFNELLEHEVERSGRSGLPLGLIMVDLDHFKQLNDAWGHEAGNRTLVEVAGILREGVRRIDAVCRYGGEEMAIVLPGARLPRAVQVAQRLRERIEQLRVEGGEEPIRVTASFGVAVLPANGVSDAHSLVQAADARLYQAKEEGRNRVCHPPLIAETPQTQVTADEKKARLE
jgi:diguanylate cyclase (GGDEF)-like protein